jgi:beta-lactamase regulating signal transducer with metallopeptidase domain
MTTNAALELVLRVSFLFSVAAVVSVGLRRGSAASRHLVWTIAFAGSLLLPVLALTAPQWDVPLVPASLERALPSAAAPSVPAPAASPRVSPPESSGHAGAASPDAARSSDPRPGVMGLRNATPLLWIWLAGAAFVLARLAMGSARMWWMARRARPLVDASWLRLARRLASALGVRERVVFLEGGPSAMPMAWGLFKGRVLLPSSARTWPVARQRVVLLHELAHIKRRDCLTQLLAQLTCAAYWFNPLAWLAANRLRAEREHACDDLVLAAGIPGCDYADHLLEIARSLRTAALPTWAAVAMAHRSQLEGRLMAILDPALPRRFPSRRRSMMLAGVMSAVVVPVATVTPVPRAASVAIASSSPATTLQTIDETKSSASARLRQDSRATPGAADDVKDVLPESARAAVPEATAEAVARAIVWGLADGVRGGVQDGVAGGLEGGIPEGVIGGVREGVVGGILDGIGEGARDWQASESADEKSEKRSADPRAVAALLEALKDSDREVRENAMQALANLRAPEALGPMRAALKDSSPDVREQAAFALGQMHDRESVEALSAALADESASVREQAAFALGQIGDPRAGAALSAALKDESANVREQAVFALGQLRDRAAVEPLIAALEDENASVREQAAFALGQIGDPRAIDGLTAALKDANVEVRRHAAFALGQISQ